MNDASMQGAVAEEVNRRLNKATEELVDKYARGEGGLDQSETGPTGEAYKHKHQQEAAAQRKSRKAKASADQEPAASSARRDEEDEDEEGDDDDVELRALRDQRLKALQSAQRDKLENIGKGHGQYREIVQDEFLAEVTGSLHVVCHFYHRDFPRCEVMGHHLHKLAAQHLETKFVRINADKAPFFVDKLKVRIMPALVLFADGIAKDRILGFDGLADAQPEGREDEWPTVRLARLLADKAMLRRDRIRDEDGELAQQQSKLTELRRAMMSAELDDDDDEDV